MAPVPGPAATGAPDTIPWTFLRISSPEGTPTAMDPTLDPNFARAETEPLDPADLFCCKATSSSRLCRAKASRSFLDMNLGYMMQAQKKLFYEMNESYLESMTYIHHSFN
jgi:hypothetical protein